MPYKITQSFYGFLGKINHDAVDPLNLPPNHDSMQIYRGTIL